MRLLRRLASAEFLRYIVVGGGTNLSLLAIFAVLIHIFPTTWPVALNVASALIVLPVSYLLNRHWVFKSDAPVGPQLRRFLVVYLTGMAVGAAVFGVLLAALPLPVLVIQVVAMALLVSIAFLIQAFWTFAHKD